MFEPNATSFDVRFRIFGIHVRVHPLFWLFSAILGWPSGLARNEQRLLVPFVLIWIGCVFVSILIHELGHVLMGRLFGSDGYIVLYSFGGVAVGSNDLRRRWQRILVTLAGPLVQLLLFGLTLLAVLFLRLPEAARHSPLLRELVNDLLLINLFWPLLNLLPIWPLDGGQVSRELCEGLMGARGAQVSLGISLVLAGLLAVNALASSYGKTLIPVVGPWLGAGGGYMVFLFALLALGSWQGLKALEAEQHGSDERWDR